MGVHVELVEPDVDEDDFWAATVVGGMVEVLDASVELVEEVVFYSEKLAWRLDQLLILHKMEIK